MFIVQCIDDYSVKTHFVSSKEIADEVAEDLSNKFGLTQVIESSKQNFYKKDVWKYDPGGMCFSKDERFECKISNMIVACDAQHFNMFIEELHSDVKLRGKNIKYIKIYGRYSIACVSLDDHDKLKEWVRNPELALKANEVFNKKLDIIKSINEVSECKFLIGYIDENDNLMAANPDDLKKVLH